MKNIIKAYKNKRSVKIEIHTTFVLLILFALAIALYIHTGYRFDSILQ